MSGNIDVARTSSSAADDADTFVLYAWPGEWGLPSLDAECLCALSYLKFSNLKHKLVAVDGAIQLFKNDYPQLEYKNETFVGLDKILERIKKEKNIDSAALSDNDYADSLALINLFKQKFVPAFNALCWMDDDNTYTVIRRAYGRYVRFPLSVFKLRQMSKYHENLLMCQYRTLQYDSVKHHIINDAKECLNMIASRLAENLFMFENQPTLIDAYLFAYLGVLHKAPFTAASHLKSHLTASTSLCSLVDRIQKDCFAVENKDLVPPSRKRDKAAAAASAPAAQGPKRFWSTITSYLNGGGNDEVAEERKKQLMAVGVGLAAMLTYAVAIGFIKIDIINTKIEYIETND